MGLGVAASPATVRALYKVTVPATNANHVSSKSDATYKLKLAMTGA